MNNIVIIAKRELRKKLVAKAALVSFGIMVIASAALPWVGHLTHPSSKNDFKFQYTALSVDDLKIVAAAFNNKFILSGADATFSPTTSNSATGNTSKKNFDATLVGPIDHLQIKDVDSSNTQFNLEINSAQTQIFQSLFLQRNLTYRQTLQQFLNSHNVKVSFKGRISTSNYPLAMADSILLYTLILLSSSTLALGVVEEKANKVIEILLSAVKPKELLLGKILGLSIFALLQFLFLGVTSTLSSHFAGANYFHGVSATLICEVVAWFIPSITFFAFLYGGLGALISRTEEIGSIQGPLSLLPIASMYASIYATLTPHALWAKICAYIPPVSFFVEPSRLIIHASSGTEFALSFLIAVGISLLAAYLMLKLFEKSILGSGKKINLLRKAINRKERA